MTASEYPGSVGTSSNCSAFCGRRTAERCWTRSKEVMGIARTCSTAGTSSFRSTSTTWSPPSNPGVSRICTMGTTSASCSTVHCWTISCGPRGSPRQGGREPPGSSSYSWKSSGWGGRGFRRRGASSRPCAPPRPLPSTVSVERSGDCSRQGPWRRSSVHTASMHGSAAPAAFKRLPLDVQLLQPAT